MGQYPSLFGAPREWAIDLAIATAIGVFLGVIGPYGSFYGGSTGLRIAYWTANVLIAFAALSVLVRLAMRFAIRLDLPVWFVIAAVIAVGSAPLSILLAYVSAWFWPPNHGRLSPLFLQYGQTLAMSEPLAFAYYFLADRGWRAAIAQARTQASPTCPSAPTPPAAPVSGSFLDRLPHRLGRELLCLQMEDHYVRAHTAKGSELILIPLKAAIAELGEIEGLQVHRSWWVARSAIAESVSRDRRLVLHLIGGLEVPVSRASVAKLRATGWVGPKADERSAASVP